MAGNLE